MVKNWLQELDFYLFESEGVDLDDLHVLKIGLKNGLGIVFGNVSTRFVQSLPEVCPKLARSWPEFFLNPSPKLAQS